MSIPWQHVKDTHIANFGYSGTMIRALRVDRGITRKQLAHLLRKRMSTVKRIENTDRIGIKLSKQLCAIFKVDNWRILRDKSFYLQAKDDAKNLIEK